MYTSENKSFQGHEFQEGISQCAENEQLKANLSPKLREGQSTHRLYTNNKHLPFKKMVVFYLYTSL